MKKWSVIVTIITLLAVTLSPIAVLAQSDENIDASTGLPFRDGLAIVAPHLALPGQEISMTVFKCSTQDPMEDAGIWAVTKDAIEGLKQEVAELRQDTSIAAEDKDYEAVICAHGTFLGRTDGKGRLEYAFSQPGRYLLIAGKRGFLPGFTGIAIWSPPKVLAVQAPWRSIVGKEITITVLQRGTRTPIADAGVWAVSKDAVEALREEVAELRQDTSIAAEDKDYEAVISAHGTFLGRTDENGKLKHAFSEPGRYLLVAAKKGYIPGFTPIVIKEPPQPTATPASPAVKG